MSSTIGSHFKVTTFGESHGPACGAVVDGLPAGVILDQAKLQKYVDRRRPGQKHTTSRNEADFVEILSGVYKGISLGTPLAMLVRNREARSQDYQELASVYRPCHGDYPWQLKYGWRDPRGGGRASGRETVSRVMAGAIAEQFLEQYFATIESEHRFGVVAWLESLGSLCVRYAPDEFEDYLEHLTREEIDASIARCPQRKLEPLLEEALSEAQSNGNSWGARVVFAVRGLPPGIGEPVFAKLNSRLAEAIISIPSAKGVEFGQGFQLCSLRGDQANDCWIPSSDDSAGQPRLATNRQGGIWGGLSTGATIWGRVAFKPTPSISLPQTALNTEQKTQTISIKGRHDPCTAIRALPVLEAMLTITIADLVLAGELSRMEQLTISN